MVTGNETRTTLMNSPYPLPKVRPSNTISMVNKFKGCISNT